MCYREDFGTNRSYCQLSNETFAFAICEESKAAIETVLKPTIPRSDI